MTNSHLPAGAASPRSWLGLLFLVAVYFLFDPVEAAIHAPIARALHLHMIEHGEMGLRPYAVLMGVRLVMQLLVVAGVLALLGKRANDFPLVGPRMLASTLLGGAIGLLVMAGAIAAIVGTGHASAVPAPQPPSSALRHGLGWLAFDFVGAAGEELFGRVAVLLVAERLVGSRGAILVSGLIFSAIHIGNPGASPIWLLRLFLQGTLLAFAVIRTRSFWWSTGYHTGWNWASAPLFGAAGSGYLDQGHLLDFTPSGPDWITGGAVGPEGSVWAFVAVLCALGLLLLTTPRPGDRSPPAARRRRARLATDQIA